MKYYRKMTLALAMGITATALNMSPALAQGEEEAEELLEEVMVTGSRIARKDLTSVGPVTIISELQIEAVGTNNLETLLQRIPAAAGFGGNSTAAYWVGNGWGTPQINLRGLGINRTLVLLNGRRLVYGGTGANSAVDLSMIPMSLVSRIEVLKDGASATYGADAVAGVVNIITKNSYDGLELTSKYGMTDEGDGEEFVVDLTWGAETEKSNIMVNISYQDTKAAPLWDNSRAPCPGQPSKDGFVCNALSSATIGGRGTVPTGYMMPDGSITTGPTRINFNQDPNGNGDSFGVYNGNVDGFNYNEYFNASNPLSRLSFATLGNYEFSDSVGMFAELLYTKRWSNQPASPATLRNLSFSADHPTNPTGIDFVMERRRLLENGARYFEQETDTFRVVTGLRGNFADSWSYEAAFNWGYNRGTDAILNNINTGRLADTLNTSMCGSNGIPCADIFGYPDVTQEVLDYIVFTETGTGGNEQTSVSGNVTGNVFELPAGPVGVAFGFEWREEKGWRQPDSLAVSGDALGNQQDPISGKVAVKEIYAEMHVPLLTDLPMIKALDLDAAIRYSDYDLFGGDTNYKLGLNWQINDGFKFRGTYSTAFRIPNVPELFGGVSEGNLTTIDPCSNWSSLSPSDIVYQNCQAAGVPNNYVQLGNTILTDAGGNPDLQPESATSMTFGLVIQPLDGLSITLDYFDIEINDAIRSTSGSTKLSLCYNSKNLSHVFCQPGHHTRNNLNGDVNFLSAQNANTGREIMKGVDFGLVYGFDTGRLNHNLDIQTTYLDTYESTAFDGDTPFVLAGHIGGGNGGYPKWRGLYTWVTSTEKWNATYSIQMIGKGDDFFVDEGLGSKMSAQYYHNIQFSYNASEALRLSAGVDNLFQNDPPYVYGWTDGNTDTMTYDLLGRRGYVRATYRWN